MTILLNLVFVVIGFILLMKGADYFVDGAATVAGKMGIPQIVVGLTIVAFGTSAPEAAISIGSAISGSAGISIGNVLGSNIMNILLILGITAVICTLKVKDSTVKVDIPYMIGASILLLVMGIAQPQLNFWTGILFWILLIIFILYLVRVSKNAEEEDIEIKELSPLFILLYLVGGMAAIILGSKITVYGAQNVASALGVTDRIIGLTVVAFGTSLPELMTSIAAARKKNADIAIGNIVGSNLFNILFVLGTTCLIKPVSFDAAFLVDGVIAIIAAVLLWLFVFRKKELRRADGIIMLVVYAIYFGYLLVM